MTLNSRATVLAGLLLLSAVPSASAQTLSLADKFDLQRQCSADIKAHCGTVARGDGRLRACLAAALPSFSEGCRATIERLDLLPPDNPPPAEPG